MILRPYQRSACDAVISWIKKTTLPCVIEMATGGGKSLCVAEIAKTVHQMSGGKKILCLAPQRELVVQNRAKYALTGSPSSVFSASLNEKSMRHPIIFGTPGTIKNKISRFGSEFAMIIVDEVHNLTPTIKTIIDAIREKNPNVRVVGMSATPYRLGTGYIFAQWPDGKPVSEYQAKDPYFEACVHRVTARDLLEQGYLTPVVVGQIGSEHYNTINMQLNRMGQFSAEDIDRAFVGHGRKTAAIIADVVEKSRDRKGVMIFAATVQHAKECLASLPPELSAIVTGETSKRDRDTILERFRQQRLKYLVNVSVLTTGVDFTHVDVIALLRATESVGLMQQIIGRSLRLHPGKENALLLDYSQTLERHAPDGDIFAPEIKARVTTNKGAALVKCKCPSCGGENEFGARQNDAGYECDEEGYFTDLDGNRIPTEFGDTPAHYGRRCQHRWVSGTVVQRCGYRWTFKECPHCLADNDIAARYCVACKGEIVDPNTRLTLAFKALKRDPTKLQTDVVHEWTVRPTVSSRGKEMDRVDVVTAYRSFSFWVAKVPVTNIQLADRDAFDRLGGKLPETITYRKDPDSGFFRVLSYNRPADVEQTTQRRAVQLDLEMMGGAA